MLASPTKPAALTVEVRTRQDLERRLPVLVNYVSAHEQIPLSRHPAWLTVLERGLAHDAFCLEAVEEGKTCGLLPLAHVRSLLFGRYLVSLPYLNYGGVLADNERTARLLIDRAIELAKELKVRYLELRHERALEHPALGDRMGHKVHMRLPLPATAGALWDRLSGKVRNQVRKGQKNQLTVAWGGVDLLGEFYTVFSHNMRDLGTPVYGKRFFESILRQFGERAELCLVRAGDKSVAAALLLHGWGISEVPSASSLHEFNSTCANMLMYWHLLERAVQRSQTLFDFGRSSVDSNTFRFKKQWGAEPSSADWQYHVRFGTINAVRPENPRYQRSIHIWKRLPLWLTRLLGPVIVRGIP